MSVLREFDPVVMGLNIQLAVHLGGVVWHRRRQEEEEMHGK